MNKKKSLVRKCSKKGYEVRDLTDQELQSLANYCKQRESLDHPITEIIEELKYKVLRFAVLQDKSNKEPIAVILQTKPDSLISYNSYNVKPIQALYRDIYVSIKTGKKEEVFPNTQIATITSLIPYELLSDKELPSYGDDAIYQIVSTLLQDVEDHKDLITRDSIFLLEESLLTPHSLLSNMYNLIFGLVNDYGVFYIK